MKSARSPQYMEPSPKVHPEGNPDPDSQRFKPIGAQEIKRYSWRMLHLLRRLLAVCAVVSYIDVSMEAVTAANTVLNFSSGQKTSMEMSSPIPLAAAFAGTTTVRLSPIVVHQLGNTTTPRSDTLYLDYVNETSIEVSNISCSSPLYREVYDNAFVRMVLAMLVADTSYNHTFFSGLELVTPVVDCTWAAFNAQYELRIMYVMRSTADPDDVYFLAFQLSAQDYAILAENRAGSAGVVMFSYFNDMQMTNVPNYFAVAIGYPFHDLSFEAYEFLGVDDDCRWRLGNIANPAEFQTKNEVVTAMISGFYLGEAAVQANTLTTYTAPESTPLAMLANWTAISRSTINDSRAWVHFIHAYFVCDTLFNLLILLLLIVRNVRKNAKLWIGDAFASISHALLMRSAAVLLTWIMDNLWVVREYAVYDINVISAVLPFECRVALVRADLMTLYLGLATVVGLVLRVRIDPAFAMLTFQIAFTYRDDILRSWPAIVAYMTDESVKNMELSGVTPDQSVSDASPMSLWTTHPVPAIDAKLLLTPILPIFALASSVVAYALLRKAYYRLFPPELRVIKGSRNMSTAKERLVSLKSNYTMFEIATGVELQVQYGVMSDYENYVVRKGVKYASADGVYCSGYVIAGGKFLVATEDPLTIILMKLSRLRFTNVYVHEVKDKTVEQTGRLVFPQTIAWAELLDLNIGMLS